MKLEKTLKRRVGPLALWVWLIGLVAAAVVYRRLRGQQTAAGATDTTTAGAPSLAASGLGTPAIAGDSGAGGDQPLQPAAQQTVDPYLADGGVGTPFIYDPTGGGYNGDNTFTDTPYTDTPYTDRGPSRGGDQPGPGDNQPPTGKLPVVHLAGGAIYDPNTDTVTLPRGRGNTTARPRNTKGQASPPKPGAGPAATKPAPKKKVRSRPVARGHKAPAANARAAAPISDVASSRLRSTTAATPNNNIRTVAAVAAPPPPPPRPEFQAILNTPEVQATLPALSAPPPPPPAPTQIPRAGRTVME